ncbi:DNA-binding PucR family transcriptional regulator [Nocardia transvalensis]|uniref:DNA-binding PucR family transcriptional regulator n=1 Tax=Nocardia transvalensis TaxID=37333 RepID=A0A7W9PIE2_9NOCA|nr:helix-turn-helix domain-containing protein [Nocardia transvalensis]MBB5916632.1 DNA-binding PucR family transcriptional regulator [Nocardia transvalensis]
MQAYLDTRGSLGDAAARLHVHKNTVHYRIRKAEDVLGHSLAVNRVETEVALRICEQLGLERL